MKNKITKKILAAMQIFVFLFLPSNFAFAQSGVLISTDENAKKLQLKLAVMNVDITLDNQNAVVKIVQVFENRTPQTLEGKYVFALPEQSSISDFAVWENDVRLPSVMMEKRRANQIYESVKNQRIDPGILQATDENESATGFSAKIFPINPYGTKRLEMEYAEVLPIENFTSNLTVPLAPSYGELQSVGSFNLKIRVLNETSFAVFSTENSAFPLQFVKSEPNEFIGEFHAENLELKDDFQFAYRLATEENKFSVVAYRSPEKISAYDLRDPQTAEKSVDGFFQAQTFFGANPSVEKSPKRVVLMLDTSLSMYGNKLARAVEAVDFFLHSLTSEDEFNLILFNGETQTFFAAPIKANTEAIENAMKFVKNSTLEGGTNLRKALQTAVDESKKFSDGERQIVLISDADPTLETIKIQQFESIFSNQNARLFAFAIGANANTELLENLTSQTHGYYDSANETEDIGTKLRLFFETIGAPDIANLKLADDANLYDIYASGTNSFFGSNFSFVGRYRKPKSQKFGFSANFGNQKINLSSEINLPESDETHSFLPRVWAQARINAILQTINREGEREEYITEIIRLSEKYKIVTPYTALIAAPRALLRPRLIQPGDPVIRVKTDESVTEVFAVLPFGETLPLKFSESEKVWETRFLAPVWMADGTYKCRLLLTDKNGNGYAEEKTFVVDSRAPRVKILLEKNSFKTGEIINLKVSADSDTNRLNAKLYGAKSVSLAWSNQEKSNVGKLKIPENLIAGKYVLTVTAEDFAHNQTTEEIAIEVR